MSCLNTDTGNECMIQIIGRNLQNVSVSLHNPGLLAADIFLWRSMFAGVYPKNRRINPDFENQYLGELYSVTK